MKKIICIMFFIILSGCTLFEVNVDVLSERTALENQILGTYNSLDREMLLTSSVRGVDAKGNIKKPPKHSQEHNDAIAAIQLQDFHRDDIRRLKKMKFLGENNQGLLEIISTDKKEIPEELKEFSSTYKEEEFKDMVKNVNHSRMIIMRRVIDLNENLSKKDLLEIQRVFGKLNAENAALGEKFQTQNGKWIEK